MRVNIRPDEIREARAITDEYWEDGQRLDARVRFPNNTQPYVNVTGTNELWEEHRKDDNGFDLRLEEEVARTFTAFPDRFSLPEERDDKPRYEPEKLARERKIERDEDKKIAKKEAERRKIKRLARDEPRPQKYAVAQPSEYVIDTSIRVLTNLPYLRTKREVADFAERQRITYSDIGILFIRNNPPMGSGAKANINVDDLEDILRVFHDGNGRITKADIWHSVLAKYLTRGRLISYLEDRGIDYTTTKRSSAIYINGKETAKQYVEITFNRDQRIKEIRVLEKPTEEKERYRGKGRRPILHKPTGNGNRNLRRKDRELVFANVEPNVAIAPDILMPGLLATVTPARLYQDRRQ